MPFTHQKSAASTQPGQSQLGKQPQRPDSAPNPRVRLRQYNELAQQLKNTVAETKRPPPAGADVEAIAARRTKLERVLRDVEDSIAATKREQQANQTLRYKRAVEQQVEKEAKITDEMDQKAKESEAVQKRYWDYTLGERRQHNAKTNKRTEKAFEHLDQQHQERVLRNHNATLSRQQKLASMEARQMEQRAASAHHRQLIREHTQQLYERKLAADAQRQKDHEDLAKQRKEEYNRRVAVLQERKAQQSKTTTEHRVKAKKLGTFDHEKAWEEMRAREQDQQDRYRHEEAIRHQERMKKRALAQQRQDKRESHFLALCDKHEQERKDIKDRHQQRADFVSFQRAETADRMAASREERDQSIQSHQEKARQRHQAKLDAGFQSNFNRWSKRADHIMTKIIGSYENLTSPERSRALGAAGAASAPGSPQQQLRQEGSNEQSVNANSHSTAAALVGSPNSQREEGGSSIRRRLPSSSGRRLGSALKRSV